MSPEQVRGLPIDRRSDVFAVGIVLYELLTGERLFVGESDFSTLEKVRNVEILPPSTYNRQIPDELERIVLKALAKDPEDRYQNAIDLHDELQAFVYTAGEFYSRKDLAAWMKKTFATEIEEETAKLEEFRQIAAPVAAERRGVAARRRRRGARGPSGRDRREAGAQAAEAAAQGQPARTASVHQAMGWDDEELDTQIFDKEEVKPVAAEDLFFEDDDRTVANEPAPDILEQARPPELLTPRPITLTPAERGHQVDAAAGGAAAAAAAGRAPADAGGRSAGRHAGAPDPARARARHAAASAAGRAAARARRDSGVRG